MKKGIFGGAVAALGVAALVAAAVAIAQPSSREQAAASPSCSTASIGFAGPVTGPAAFLGLDQQHWVQTFLAFWNAGKPVPGVPAGTKRVKLKIALIGDSQLSSQAATTVAAQMTSNKAILAMVGFAGSNENLGGGPVLDRAGMAYVSGSATADQLTRTLKGFYRVVPNNTKQAAAGIAYIMKHGLKKGDQAMVVDDAEAYGVGIATAGQRFLKAAGVKVDRESLPESTSSSTADFSSLAQKAVAIGAKFVYAPTQVASDSQLFREQLKTAGYNGLFMATDGSFDASNFKFPGAYISFFGTDVYQLKIAKPFIAYYTKRYGKTTPFGAPSFVSAEMIALAISKSCADGKVTRAEVKKNLRGLSIKTSILGHEVGFDNAGDVKRGPARGVTVFRIQANGTYKLVFTA